MTHVESTSFWTLSSQLPPDLSWVLTPYPSEFTIRRKGFEFLSSSQSHVSPFKRPKLIRPLKIENARLFAWQPSNQDIIESSPNKVQASNYLSSQRNETLHTLLRSLKRTI
mmetsp:Transcript_14604/g.19955  ORF Transcript_14604/g.19955 Transcript_14604/m.19955 type:complete len:111 (-) Transcript_14604:507-839(-)